MKKWLIYFNERFPLQSHIPIIFMLTCSAYFYSYFSSSQTGSIKIRSILSAFLLTFTTFLLLRISDEFKDHELDNKYRQYLPVPRGIISLLNLKHLAILLFAIQAIVLMNHSYFLLPYLVAMLYLLLMHHEFFIPKWLKNHQFFYVISHMMIIPLVDFVASSAHWSSNDLQPSKSLWWFFIVSDEQYGLTSQLRRASVSIAANIAEGASRGTDKQFIRFLYISKASAAEVETLLLVSKNLNFLSEKDCNSLIDQTDKAERTIWKLIKHLKK